MNPHFSVSQIKPELVKNPGAIDQTPARWVWGLWVPVIENSDARACIACGGPFKDEAEANADLSRFIDAVIAATTELNAGLATEVKS